MCVIFNWQEMDDFTNSAPHASRPRTQIDDGSSLTGKGRGGGMRQQLQIRFPHKQIAVANVFKAVLSTTKRPYGSVNWLATWKCRLWLGIVCLFWRGVTTGLPCVNVCVHKPHAVVCVVLFFFFLFFSFFPVTAYCLISGHSPLSTWRLPLEGQLMSAMVKSVRLDWEGWGKGSAGSVCDSEAGVKEAVVVGRQGMIFFSWLSF